MNKKHFFSALLVVIAQISFAQTPTTAARQSLINMPVAATPEAAALGKFGDIPVGLSTGIPGISIPFHQYKNSKNLEFSVGLSYHAGGHKVEDMASSTGLGWALDAGGMISRSVNGLADDVLGGYLLTDTLPYLYTQTPDYFWYVSGISGGVGTSVAITKDEDNNAWWLAKNIQDRQKDGEADLFSFNVGGLSGKFVIKKNLEIQLFTQSNVSISYAGPGEGFTILDKNTGISYLFNVTETSAPYNVNFESQYGIDLHANMGTYISNWHVSKIISADKMDTIKLNYVTNYTEYEAGFAESVSAARVGTILENVNRQGSFTNITNTKKRLQYVDLPDGTRITFFHDFPRVDLIGDSALTSVEIKNGSFKKVYTLSYDYFQSPYCELAEGTCSVYGSPNDYYKRLRLLKVQQSDGTDTLPSHRFEYNSTPLPTRKSAAQDYWGYYRGGVSGCRIGELSFSEYPESYNVLGCTDRNAVEHFAKAWVLEKMTYPTGGYTKFNYETNSAFGEDYKIDQKSDTGSLSEMFYNIYKPLPFSNRTETAVKIRLVLHADTSSYGGPSVPLGCNFDYTIKSTDNSFTTTITATIEDFLTGYYTTTVSLPLNKDYEIKFTSDCGSSLPETYHTDYFYDYKIVPIDKPIGGIRIAKTEDFPYPGAVPIVSNYSYLGTDGHSSGEFQNLPNSHYYVSTTNHWTLPEGGVPLASPYFFIHRSSGPTQTLSYFRGSPVIYKRVKVDKTNAGVSNGYTIHEFSAFSSTQVATADYPFVQKQDLEWRQGLPLRDSVFTSTNQLIKTIHNEYDYFETSSNNANSRNLLTSQIQNDDQNTLENMVFAARAYYYMSGRAALKRTRTKEFNGASVIENWADYFYDPSNYLLTRQRTLNSKGDTLENRLYYPGNYNITGIPYDVTIHNGEAEIISQEAWIKKGANWYMKEATANDYTAFSSIVRKSKTIKTELTEPIIESTVGSFNPSLLKRHASYKDDAEILKYDSKGRFTEIRKLNDQKISFIWMPFEDRLVAQVTNADESSIAYTSFESVNKGGWAFSGTATADISSPTGNSCYNLSAGNLTKTGLTSTTYIVSYWGKSGSIAVNGSGPTRSGKIVGNWQYYEHEVTTTSVTLSGSKYIDEVRLYPKVAQMVTYAYTALLGMTAQCDASNRIIYYSYDKFGRLSLIRDQDKNIIKKICYNYYGEPERCNSYYNVQKSGNFTRNDCGIGYDGSTVTYIVAANTYSASTQSAADSLAQMDVNANGQNYSNIQGTCTLSGCNSNNCSMEGYKCISNECVQGMKIYTASVFNWSTSKYDCTYHYEFSDNSWSQDYVEENVVECPVW